MKKIILLTVFLVIICNVLFAQFVVDSTKTMNSETFLALRDATEPDIYTDEVMRFYWCKLIGIDPPLDGGEGSDEIIGEKSDYFPINRASHYAKEALWGAVGHETDEHAPPEDEPAEILNLARKYLLDPDFQPDYISLDSLWVGEFSDGSWSDCLTYGSLLNNVAFIVDMLWYYDNGTYQDSLYNKLDELAGWAYELLNDTNFTGYWAYCSNPDYPPQLKTAYHNGRIRLAGALGYAGCVLDKASYIQTAELNLFEWDVPGDVSGFLPFMTSNSGTYAEGMSYTEYTFEGLSKFFVARKRLYGVDWFEDERVKSIYVNSLDLIAPNMSWIPFDDVHITYNKYWGNHYLYKPKQSFSEMVTYFYHSPDYDQESLEHIKWIINSYQAHPGYENRYFVSWTVNKFYAYNSDRTLAGLGTVPDHLQEGTYSNEELTILRRPIQTYSDYENYPVLIVNHENSANHTSHEHSDQSSFILYYKDKQLLIDPGYRPSGASYNIGKEWLVSPFAHNLIMVNPHSSFYNDDHHWEESELLQDYSNVLEYTELTDDLIEYWNDGYYDYEQDEWVDFRNPNNYDLYEYDFEPIGKSGGYDDAIAKNPADKTFLIHNNNIQHLQVEIDYDHPQGASHYPPDKLNDSLLIKRNFYSFDIESENPYFIIFDEISSSDHSISNEFMNQLHFALYPVPVNNNEYPNDPDSIDDPNQQEGKFTYTHFDNSVKLFGAMGSQNNAIWTVLDNLPQGLYFGKHWKDLDFVPPQWEHKCLRINTSTTGDEKFLTVLIPSESAYNPINVIDGDNYYAVEIYDPSKQPVEKSYYAISDNDLTISFDDVCINSTANFAGLTYRPNYTGNTKVKDFILSEGDSLFYNNIPLFKSVNFVEEVLASYGVDLNVIIKSDEQYPAYRIRRQGANLDNFVSIGVENGGNGSNNIQNIFYDDEYFYVNWYDFSEGTVNLENTIIVPENVTLYIGSGVEIYGMNPDVKIEVYGDIEIGNNVIFTAEEGESWDGLYLYNTEAEVTMNNVTFERCKLYNESYTLILSNSEFINSHIDQYGNKVYVSETNFNSSMVYCYYRKSKIPLPDDVEINISDCYFSNYIGYPVYISGYDLYNLEGNTISGCNGGFYIFKSGHPKMCLISNNSIINNYGKGIFLYDSFADILGHNIIKENSVGIVGVQNSTITIIGNRNYQYQTIKDNICQEMVFDFTSFPKEREMYYNKIIDDNIEGSSDQYLISCANYTGDPRDLIVEDNYWGPACSTWVQWTGDDRFDPSDAFDYIPIWDPGTPRSPGGSPPEQLFAEADSLILEEDYEQAKLVYKNIILLYPESDFTIYSMRNLLPLETVSGKDFSSLQAYYLTNLNCNYNPDRTKLSSYLANYCNIKLENYPDAISFFEDIILNPETELDSVYAVIDAGYTYLLMEGGGKSSYIGKIAELKPKSIVEFEDKRDKLLAKALGLPEQNEEETIPENIFYLSQNYPNPVRTSTTISFNLATKEHKDALIKIYNIKGQLVKKFSITNGQPSIEWDGKDEKGNQLSSGIYLYKLDTGEKLITKKMILLR